MDATTLTPIKPRTGFHYFPDDRHYRESDLQAWLPELRSLGAAWIVLNAPIDRAIPEQFIRGLKNAEVEPILHFGMSLAEPPNVHDLTVLLESYAKWGVKYVVFFDRPNSRSAWSVTTWVQEDLIERFLDRYLPLAETALQCGLIPVFPPLEPGGNYWDTSFLKGVLQSLQRRKATTLLERLVLSAYTWNGEHSLNWGAGGPERWPGARPYFTPVTEEDQRGFRIFDWYLAISRAVLGRSLPIVLLGVGAPLDPSVAATPVEDPANHAEQNLTIARLMAGETIIEAGTEDTELDAIPEEVLACNYWLLAAQPETPFQDQAWFQSNGQSLPVVGVFRQWVASHEKAKGAKKSPEQEQHPIDHYLLLPAYDWGIADWHLDIIRPYVKKYRPTIGFSLEEAEYARQVTVIGDAASEDEIDHLRAVGCLVEWIDGDGTIIATSLAER
ncbi:MAG TPA: hypothetical protein VHO48_02370 [Anaerolineaceae bacterium]|nr:hypothetical protein [Anaerolineaceae bacterium]